MAVVVGTAYIPVVPDLDGFGKRIGADLSRQQKGFASSFAGVGKSMALAFGGAFAATVGVDFARGAIDAASSLNETVSKSQAVFGPASASIEKWASGASKAFGQSKAEALAAASSFGNLFTQIGFGAEPAAEMSQSLTELASDFASFHNADISDVIRAQEAAFIGEYDALQKFVPTINAAAVEQKALALSGKATTKELTAQDRALATQRLMLEGAGKAAGDFARTSDSLANRQRTASAQWKDMQTTIGNGLLPVMTRFVGFMSGTVMPALSAMGNWISDNKTLVAGFAIVIGGALVGAFIAWAASAWAAAAGTLAAAAPFIAVGVAVAALVAGIVILVKHWDEIWAKVKEITTTVLGAVVGFITDLPGKLVDALRGAWGAFSSFWSSVFNAVKDFVSDRVDDVVGFISGLPGRLLDVLKGAWGLYWDYYVGVWLAVATFVGEKIGEVAGFVAGLPGRAKDALVGVWHTFSSYWTEIWDGIKNYVASTWTTVIEEITKLPGRVASAAVGLFDGIKTAFKSAINWIIDKWNGLEFTIGGQKIDLPGPLGSIKIPDITLGTPHIPRLHSGGEFRAMNGTEGLALLRDRELVTTPETMDEVIARLDALLVTVSRLPADYVQRNRAA